MAAPDCHRNTTHAERVGRLKSEEKRLERTVNINLAGRRTPVTVASDADSDALVGLRSGTAS